MTEPELKQFYEKLYFLEIEARDKIHARLQLPLTLLLAIAGVVVFLFQNYQPGQWNSQRVTFVFFFCAGAVLLTIAVVSFVKALWNHDYYFLPAPNKTAEYKTLLEATYEGYEDQTQLVSNAIDKYLTDYYIEYTTFNTQVNDRRSAYLHICNGAIIGTAVLFICAYLAFYFGDLDKSKMRSPTEVLINKPIDIRIQGK